MICFQSQEQQEAQMQRAAAQEEQRQAIRAQKTAMMQQILSDQAYARLGAIASVKPEKAERLENIILQNVQRGTIQPKVSEA